jgi:hypothetical protein
MTQDDIVVMAVNAGANSHFVKHHIAFIESFAKLVAAKEREACAMLCEAEWSTVAQQAHSYDLAEAIRARGEA